MLYKKGDAPQAGRPPKSGKDGAGYRLEQEMFFWFLVAAGIIVGLTLLGAVMTRRNPDTAWERHEDTPMGPDPFH
jgi:type VI protein secretion system component VasF